MLLQIFLDHGVLLHRFLLVGLHRTIHKEGFSEWLKSKISSDFGNKTRFIFYTQLNIQLDLSLGIEIK